MGSGGSNGFQARLFDGHGGGWARRLPALRPSMADFGVRGFNLDHPEPRAVLERHARSFLSGFNLGREHWRSPHEALAGLPVAERGFAYEGAAMLAGIVDTLTLGRSRAIPALLDGPGDGYRHLIHVGVGWAFAKLRVPAPSLLRLHPLLRWLSLDGVGFHHVYFRPDRALQRLASRPVTQRSTVVAQGCGRALWFVEATSIPGIARRIDACPPRLRPHLWSGVGLASVYAGPPPDVEQLRQAAGAALRHLQQGAVFAGAARHEHGFVPEHTARTLRELTGIDPATAAMWSDETSADLAAPGLPLTGYLRWRRRLRDRLGAAPLGRAVAAHPVTTADTRQQGERP